MMVFVSRTNIDIDDDLIAVVMDRYRLDSKRAAVDLALRSLIGTPMSTDEILGMAGTGFDYDNDELEAMSDIDGAA
jgi:Arc/MetJ family transcription regulator